MYSSVETFDWFFTTIMSTNYKKQLLNIMMNWIFGLKLKFANSYPNIGSIILKGFTSYCVHLILIFFKHLFSKNIPLLI